MAKTFWTLCPSRLIPRRERASASTVRAGSNSVSRIGAFGQPDDDVWAFSALERFGGG